MPFGKNWLVTGDIVSSSLEGTPASGGVPAIPDSDNDMYYSLQFIRNNLFKEGNTATVGLRYSDTTTYEKMTYTLMTRYPFTNKWRLIPRLDIDDQDLSDGSDVFTLRPSLKIFYRPTRRLRFEFEGGYSKSEYRNSTNDRDEENTFFTFALIKEF
jgi:hypothetical protein